MYPARPSQSSLDQKHVVLKRLEINRIYSIPIPNVYNIYVGKSNQTGITLPRNASETFYKTRGIF